MHTQDVGCLFFAFLFIGYAVGILIGVPNLWIYLGVLFFVLYFSKKSKSTEEKVDLKITMRQ